MRCDKGEEMTVEGTYVTRSGGKTKLNKKEVTDKFVDFTALAKKHGFHSIRARSSFFRGGSYGGAEWWHFQYESALTVGKSTFGEELLKVYPLAKKHGFHSIRARSSFFRGGSYGGAEWWHFQYENALTVGKSTFGEELLTRIYARGEWEYTGDQWFVVALYDMDYKLDLSRPTRG
jgi:hypothetical protein